MVKGPPCACSAYKFPHRWGGGKCGGTAYVCTGCGNACNPVKRDFGYGAYEYGSERGCHSIMAWVSDCCEADVYYYYEDERNAGQPLEEGP